MLYMDVPNRGLAIQSSKPLLLQEVPGFCAKHAEISRENADWK